MAPKGKSTTTKSTKHSNTKFPSRSSRTRSRAKSTSRSPTTASASASAPARTATSTRRQSSSTTTTTTNIPRDNSRRRHRKHNYAYLKPHTRHIAERTIKSKWTTLAEPAQEKVRELFRSLERPVIVRQKDDKRRVEAQVAVGAVVKNLTRRLPRMPFPPMTTTRSVAFDYEGTLNENRALEVQLSNMTNTIDLLKVEVEREEALLAQEKRQLEELEKNAKRAESEWKRQMKNEHPVLKHLDNLPQSDDPVSTTFSILERPEEDVALCENDPDPQLLPLLTQLNDHLQSMQNNVGPFSGLRDAITSAEAALDMVVPAD